MAKFPTEVERTTTVGAPRARVYAFFWDVAGSARCIPGIDRCERVGADTYRFVYQERSTGPVSLVVRYTAAYTGNGTDEIRFRGVGAPEDNTDVEGVIRLAASGEDAAGGGATRVTLRQAIAPETPVPRLLQGLIRSFVQREAEAAVDAYLAAVGRTLVSGA
jgi:carbon monoxide dehydrogenase subunit G